jgi:hypothetical protein
MNLSSFTIKKSVLIKTLTEISKIVSKIRNSRNSGVLEMTITDGKLTLIVPGAKHELDCETISSAKVSISLFYYLDIIKSQRETTIHCIITDNTIEVKGLLVSAQTTFFETDRILRSIKMPLNYTDFHLLKLEKEGYTEEEIEFNDLNFDIRRAKKTLAKNILKTLDLLNVYGVNKKEIKELVYNKIGLK